MPSTSTITTVNNNCTATAEDYVLITVAKQNFSWEARVLSRGMPYLPVRATLPNRLKSNTRVAVGDVCLADMRDVDNNEGTADIVEVIDPKNIRKLRHKGLIPEEEEYSYLLVSDKRLGYTGGAFPYKAKLTGLGPSTMPEDEDVIARARYLERKARREARKAEGGMSGGAVSSAGTTPATSPPLKPATATAVDGPMAGLCLAGGNAINGGTVINNGNNTLNKDGSSSSSNDGGAAAVVGGGQRGSSQHNSDDTDEDEQDEEAFEDEEVEEEEEEDASLTNIVNPNRPQLPSNATSKWSAKADGGVSKGYVSKRERRDLEMEQRLRKRNEGFAPRQSPSLIPQMEALDRVGGDAELESI